MDPDFPFLDVDVIADAADIPEPVNFLDDHQFDIPENGLSLTYFTRTVFSPKFPRRGWHHLVTGEESWFFLPYSPRRM
jgi:hypothetical protein